MLFISVINALKLFARADRPVHRIGLDTKLRLYLLHKIERISGLTVHFIYESKYRDMAHNADLEKLSGLIFHTL